MKELVKFRLNGKPVEVEVESDRHLLWVLRTDLGMTGSKYGCGKGQCGACTVVVGRRAVRSCLVTVGSVAGKEVVTIEGLAEGERLHPLQEAFIEHDALQCGICTSGMIMNAYALLMRNSQPTREQIVQAMDGNLCRCGTYKRIIEAVETAAQKMKGVPNHG